MILFFFLSGSIGRVDTSSLVHNKSMIIFNPNEKNMPIFPFLFKRILRYGLVITDEASALFELQHPYLPSWECIPQTFVQSRGTL